MSSQKTSQTRSDGLNKTPHPINGEEMSAEKSKKCKRSLITFLKAIEKFEPKLTAADWNIRKRRIIPGSRHT